MHFNSDQIQKLGVQIHPGHCFPLPLCGPISLTRAKAQNWNNLVISATYPLRLLRSFY